MAVLGGVTAETPGRGVRLAKGKEPQPAPGSDRDAHGCIASAGYAWCANTNQCERPWELARKHGFEQTKEGFDAFCENPLEIGRASCRERVCQYVEISVVAVSLKKKKKKHAKANELNKKK